MKKLVLLVMILASCKQAGKGSYFATTGNFGQTKPTPKRPEPPKPPPVAPEAAWLAQCKAPIDQAKTSIASILAVSGVRSVDNTLEPFNEAWRHLNNTGNWAHLHSEVHPDAKILAAGGTKDAADLVKDFLGRAYNFKAFEKYLSDAQ